LGQRLFMVRSWVIVFSVQEHNHDSGFCQPHLSHHSITCISLPLYYSAPAKVVKPARWVYFLF
jgi:hypothetical protein